MSANARHSKEQPNWQTPTEDIQAARVALGGRIDLDVFSCASAQLRVGALDYFGPDHPSLLRRDGFAAPWRAETIFCNHPGGTLKKSWQKVCREYRAGHFRRLIWIGFSVEQVCVLSEPGSPSIRWAEGRFVPTDFSICFLRKRIHFIDPDRPDRPDRPGHANFILGIGTEPSTFTDTYADLGQCTHGPLACFTEDAWPRNNTVPWQVLAP